METFVVQSDNNGLFILVGDTRCYPTAETSYKAGEQAIVEISGAQAVIKDKPTANAYTETWQAALPKLKPKHVHVEKEFVWLDLIEKEIYFIPFSATVMLWSFVLGWFLGWALIQIH
jgi:hypothetical protein